MAVLDVSSETPRSTDIRKKNNYTKWLGALVCAYLSVRVPVRRGEPVLPIAALVPLSPVPPARTATCPCWVAQCCERSSFVPLSVTVATKEENLCRKPPIERRIDENREKRAPCRRPATKSPFKRTFCEVNVGRATATTNGNHMRRKLRSTRDPP